MFTDTHVLVTFFNNSISNVTQLSALPGGRIAISFKANKIVEIQKDAFGNIGRLVYLDLSKNRISGTKSIFKGVSINYTRGFRRVSADRFPPIRDKLRSKLRMR